jgi:sialate O-acetylesterase
MRLKTSNWLYYFSNDSSIVVGFRHVEGGLVTHGPDPPGPFAVAGADGVYYPATAVAYGLDALEVSSPWVEHPKSIRYGWGPYPSCNLFNGVGLPASPFQLTFR